MTGRLAAALALLVAGALLRIPIVTSLGLLAVVVEGAHGIWARRGLAGVAYARHLDRRHLEWGEEAELRIEVWNRKRLPLSWLRADDAASDGIVVRERPTVDTPALGTTLRNAWSLAPFERVVRHLRVGADRRGVFTLGPALVTVGDPFARAAASEELPDVETFLVRPRVVPATSGIAPTRWGDVDRARRGPIEDPARFAGVRPYSPGDPLRRLHHRASARLGQPMTKRFEPSRERDVLIALDLETDPAALGPGETPDDADEAVIVVAASLVRAIEAQGAGVGLSAAGYARRSRYAEVPVSAAAGRGDRILDVLARLSLPPSARFPTLLARILAREAPATTVLVLTARDPRRFLGGLRALRHRGFGVVLVATGAAAETHAAAARAAGFEARIAVLDGPWRTAERLLVA